MIELAGLSNRDDARIAHDHDSLRGGEDLAEQMRDENAAHARSHMLAHEGQELSRDDGVERGGRLVEDDQTGRVVGNREGSGDLDHLPLGDRQVADDLAGVDAVTRKDPLELIRDEVGSRLPPAPAADSRMHDAGVLGNRQVRAERQLLEDAADTMTVRCTDVVAIGEIAAGDLDSAAIGPKGAREDAHQRRLAGAVMADETQALAGTNVEIDAGQSLDGAEALLDTVQAYQALAFTRLGHRATALPRSHLADPVSSPRQ